MKDRNTDYNLLDLIEKSSQLRQSQQETPVQSKETGEVLSVVPCQDRETAPAPVVDAFQLKITRDLAPVVVEDEPAVEEEVVETKPTFFQKVGDFFKSVPDRTKEWFRTFPERSKEYFADFGPRFLKETKYFFKYINWTKVSNRIFTCLLYPLTIYLLGLAAKYTNQIESLFSDGLNYIIRLVLNVLSSLTTIVISDVCTWALIIILAGAVITTIIKLFTEKHGYRKVYAVLGLGSGFCVFLAVIFFVGQLFQGANAYRKPLDQIMNMTVQQSTTDELVSVSENLVYRAAEVREYLEEDSRGVVYIADRNAYLTNAAYGFQRGIRYFGNLTFQSSTEIGNLEFKMSVAKFTNFSKALDWQNRDGCYQPYTGEVLINKSVSDMQLPATVNYYLAAQMGFTDPEACSFLAFLAGVNHSDPYYNYSSLMYGLSLCLEELYETDYAAWTAVRNSFTVQMNRDIAATEMYNWFATGQGQEDDSQTITNVEGVATNNGLAVDLILSYYREGYMKDVHVGVYQPEETTSDVTTDVTDDVTTDSSSNTVTE